MSSLLSWSFYETRRLGVTVKHGEKYVVRDCSAEAMGFSHLLFWVRTHLAFSCLDLSELPMCTLMDFSVDPHLRIETHILPAHLSLLTAKESDGVVDDSLSHLIFLAFSMVLNGWIAGVGWMSLIMKKPH